MSEGIKKIEEKLEELIWVRITRKEFLKLPMNTRRRIVKEQLDAVIKNDAQNGVSNSCEAMGLD